MIYQETYIYILAVTFGALASVALYVSGNRINSEKDKTIANLQLRAGELERETSAAKLELARLSDPRTLTEEQSAKLSHLLAGAPRGHVVVFGDFGFPEARRFGQQIQAFLTKEGYDTTDTDQKNHILSVGNLGVLCLSET